MQIFPCGCFAKRPKQSEYTKKDALQGARRCTYITRGSKLARFIVIVKRRTNHESLTYRDVRKATTRITRLWQPNVQARFISVCLFSLSLRGFLGASCVSLGASSWPLGGLFVRFGGSCKPPWRRFTRQVDIRSL